MNKRKLAKRAARLIRQVQVLKLQPGDTLVATLHDLRRADGTWRSPNQAEIGWLLDLMRARFGQGCGIIVRSNVKFSVVRPTATPETQP